MKNKESHNRVQSSNTYRSKASARTQTDNKSTFDNNSKCRGESKGTPIYSKSQIERLKKFYHTTKWLPNTAFTTYFGKPAFENYGYGNTKPVYGGLFYGNYMLSHNINPIDGGNTPDTKQVYSSAMLKAIKRNDVRRPEPPRKTPEEIRNTKEELEELKTRNQIFQLPNQFPRRDIMKPELLKSRYFRSGKNTPRKSSDYNSLNHDYEVFNIEDVVYNKKLKKAKISSKHFDTDFNPYEQGKVKLPKRKSSDLYPKKETIDSLSSCEDEEGVTRENFNKEINDYTSQKRFYERMLTEENKSDKYDSKKNLKRVNSSKNCDAEKKQEDENAKDSSRNVIENEEICLVCQKDSKDDLRNDTRLRLKKNENPCLLAPGHIKNAHVCCIHGNEEKLKISEMNPKYYNDKPPCALIKITPAGKPIRKSVTVAELLK